MTELQEQLAALRARMARVLEECAEKYEKPGAPVDFSGEQPLPGDAEGVQSVQHAEDFSAENAFAGENHAAFAGRKWVLETRAARARTVFEQRAANAAATRFHLDRPSADRFHVDEWLPGKEIETEH